MEDDRRERMMSLFAEALELPSSLHSEWLRTACPDDDGLRAEVAALLQEDVRAAAYFDGLAASLFGSNRPGISLAHDPLDIVGRSIAHYHVVEHLGGGGMGVVYRAVDSRLNREVALKFLPPDLSRDRESERRFQLEAQAVSALDHPNICTLYEIDEFESRLFMAMAYCEGVTLKQLIAAGPLELPEAVRIAVQIARGLGHAHANGIVHRDVKPANVIVLGDGRVKLLDFGLAKFADRTQVTTPGAAVGTFAYMSPEQIRGEEVDARADVWSLGVLIYEMIAGQRPFGGSDPQVVLYSILHSIPEPLSSRRGIIPAALQRVVERCMTKTASNRYENADAVAESLERIEWRGAAGRVSADRHLIDRGVLMRPASLTVGGLAVLLVVLLLVLPLLRHPLAVNPAAGDHRRAQLLAIFPFDVDERDQELSELASGMAELVGRLLADGQRGRDSRLHIIPEHEVRRRGAASPADARLILGSDLVANVGLSRTDRGIRGSVKLVDARTLRSLGSDTFVSDSFSALPIYRRLLNSITTLLEEKPSGRGGSASAAIGTGDSLAFRSFVLGLALLERLDVEEKVDEAIDAFTSAIAQDPAFARAHAGLCEAYWRKHAHAHERIWTDGGLQSCHRAIELDPELVSAHVTLADLVSGTGRHEEALDHTDNALAIDPSNAEAYRVRARVLMRLGRTDEAETAYHAAIRQLPNDWLGHNALGTFYLRLGRYEEAATAFRHAISIAPENAWVLENLGAANFALDRLQEARSSWEQALQIRSDYVSLSNLGTLSFFEGRMIDAADYYERALAVDDRDFRVWGNLASAYHWAPGSRPKARAAYDRAARLAEQALSINPNAADVLAGLAGYEVQLGRATQARMHVIQALSEAPDDPEILLAASDVFEQMGSRDEAILWLNRAIRAGVSRLRVDRNPWLQDLRNDPRLEIE